MLSSSLKTGWIRTNYVTFRSMRSICFKLTHIDLSFLGIYKVYVIVVSPARRDEQRAMLSISEAYTEYRPYNLHTAAPLVLVFLAANVY